MYLGANFGTSPILSYRARLSSSLCQSFCLIKTTKSHRIFGARITTIQFSSIQKEKKKKKMEGAEGEVQVSPLDKEIKSLKKQGKKKKPPMRAPNKINKKP